MTHHDPLKRVLYIDLSHKRFWVEEREALFEKYIGGAGVAIQLLLQECPEGTGPLSEDNPIVMAVGPLTGLYPQASKTVAMFKSPLTGNLGESHCGGRSAVSIRLAGYGAIVIKGKSDRPLYVAIHGNNVFFRDATTLWGMSSGFTVGRILQKKEPGEGLRTIMRIGRGGENLVSYACVTTESYRHFGRLGLGAVFGAKKLKALVVSGKSSLPVTDRKEYRKIYDEIYETAVKSDVMKKYHDLGTASNVLPLNAIKGLPTKNLQQSRTDHAARFSGEQLAEKYLGRRLACSHCPVGCVHLAAIREPYEHEQFFYKTSMISYDYEPVFALGTMLGGSDAEGMLRLMDEIEKLGIDVMSTGVVLAWATECAERGLLSDRHTDGIQLQWGNYAEYKKAVGAISEKRNELFEAMSKGVAQAAGKYGGEEFALSMGDNEMPGYHTGPGAHVGCLVGARHSHLDNAGYSIDQKNAGKELLPVKKMAELLLREEAWRQILSSLVVCFFARGIYSEQIAAKALATADSVLTMEELQDLGMEIYREKYKFKLLHGFDFKSLRIPGRIFETESATGMLDEKYMRAVIEEVRKAVAHGGS